MCECSGITLVEIPYWWDHKMESIANSIVHCRPDLVSNNSMLSKCPYLDRREWKGMGIQLSTIAKTTANSEEDFGMNQNRFPMSSSDLLHIAQAWQTKL